MKKIIVLIIFCGFIGGCQPQKKPQLIGGDKDSHGCIPSAGYTWCEKKNKCLRVWEEKCE